MSECYVATSNKGNKHHMFRFFVLLIFLAAFNLFEFLIIKCLFLRRVNHLKQLEIVCNLMKRDIFWYTRRLFFSSFFIQRVTQIVIHYPQLPIVSIIFKKKIGYIFCRIISAIPHKLLIFFVLQLFSFPFLYKQHKCILNETQKTWFQIREYLKATILAGLALKAINESIDTIQHPHIRSILIQHIRIRFV